MPETTASVGDGTDSASDVACCLDESGRRERAERLEEELLPFLDAVDAIDDGYRLTFEGDEDALEPVTTHVRREAECCPFARYEVEIAPHAETIEVRITGEGVDAMVAQGMRPLIEAVDGVSVPE